MSDATNDRARDAAADEAAQNVVEGVTSWNYSAERDIIEEQLDEGFQEARVEVGESERQRIVKEIDELKRDETRGAPRVESGEVREGDRS